MNKKLLIAALGSVGIMMGGLANAATVPHYKPNRFAFLSHAYVGIFGGAALTYQRKSDTVGTNVDSRRYTITNDEGWNAGLNLGYQFKYFRLEGSIGYTDASLNYFQVGDNDITASSGSTSLRPFMLNAYYDITHLSRTIYPYVGIGAGGVWIHEKAVAKGDSNGAAWSIEGTEVVYAYQGIAGLMWNVHKNLGLSLDYHYLKTGVAEFNATNDTSRRGNFKTFYRYNLVNLGLIYRFS